MTGLLAPAASAGIAPVVQGSPRFDDAELARVARDEGDLAAWTLAFARHGSAAAAGVQGDFAVALQDAAGRTWLAVDRFAVQTLCYRVTDGRLEVATRADALAGSHAGAAAPGAADLDLQALFDYLYFHCIPSPRTIFRHVHRVPPGHGAVFERGRLTLAPYWTPVFEAPHEVASFDALRDEFRTLLRASVARELDGGKPGCFLSGGTDSSTVAGMIGVAAGRPAATYSIGFEADGYDEMAYARIAARHFGTEHHEHYVTPADLLASMAEVAGHYDQPFGNSSALPAFCCARMAQADGVTRMLAGDGGDELFGGNSRYAKQRVFGWYARVPEPLRRGLVEPLTQLAATGRVPLARKARSYVEQAGVPMPDRLQMYNLLLRLGVGNVLAPAFLDAIDADAPARQQREVWRAARAASELDRTLAFDWRYTLSESDLPKVCGTARLAGLEVGFPLLDAGLLAFSMRLPPDHKLRGMKLRWFFKEALRGFLPDEILAKKKQGFGLPFGVWLTRHAGLRAFADDVLASLSTRGLVHPVFIASLLRERLAEHPAYYGEMVWILMMLELWIQKHAPGARLT